MSPADRLFERLTNHHTEKPGAHVGHFLQSMVEHCTVKTSFFFPIQKAAIHQVLRFQ